MKLRLSVVISIFKATLPERIDSLVLVVKGSHKMIIVLAKKYGAIKIRHNTIHL